MFRCPELVILMMYIWRDNSKTTGDYYQYNIVCTFTLALLSLKKGYVLFTITYISFLNKTHYSVVGVPGMDAWVWSYDQSKINEYRIPLRNSWQIGSNSVKYFPSLNKVKRIFFFLNGQLDGYSRNIKPVTSNNLLITGNLSLSTLIQLTNVITDCYHCICHILGSRLFTYTFTREQRY